MVRTERCPLIARPGSFAPAPIAGLALVLVAAFAPAPAAAAEPGVASPRSDERSLDAITIEGIVNGPEVLFINAREPARLELTQGWRLLAAAGLLEPALPAPRTFNAELSPAAGDPIALSEARDPTLNP